jgi:hypothetical protein
MRTVAMPPSKRGHARLANCRLVGGRIGGELLPVVVWTRAAKAALLLPETVRIIRLCGDQIFQPLQPSRFKETEDDDDSHQHGSNQY